MQNIIERSMIDEDKKVLNHIKKLADEKSRLYSGKT